MGQVAADERVERVERWSMEDVSFNTERARPRAAMLIFSFLFLFIIIVAVWQDFGGTG